MNCRIYDTDCINPRYCGEADACCAGDPSCVPSIAAPYDVMWNGCVTCNWTRRMLGRAYCPWCAKEIGAALSCLAGSLAIGAALCRAFDLGGLLVADEVYAEASRWAPGCGRSAP